MKHKLMGLLAGISLLISLLFVTITHVTPQAASASVTCSGQSGHSIFDNNQGNWIGLTNDYLWLAGFNFTGWYVYYDNNPSSPEYQYYSLCTEDSRSQGWITWTYDGVTCQCYLLTANAASPWTNPGYSFFKPDCVGPNHEFYALFSKEDGSGMTSVPNPSNFIGVNLNYWDHFQITGIC